MTLKEFWVNINSLALPIFPQNKLSSLSSVEIENFSLQICQLFGNGTAEIFRLRNIRCCLVGMIYNQRGKSVNKNFHVEVYGL